MLRPRSLLVGFLSFLLFLSLMGTAFSFSVHDNLGNPTNAYNWVNESGFYTSIINRITSQAQSTIGSGAGNIEPTVRPLAEAAFPLSEFKQDVSTIVNANYAWLEGHSSTPQFSIDANSIKLSFASQVEAYLDNHLSGLPKCTSAQNAQLKNANPNPWTLACLPTGVNPTNAASQASSAIKNSNLLLSNPIINADSLKAVNSGGSPYYQRLSRAPKAYKWINKAPWLLSFIDIVLASAILVLSRRKKRGVAKISLALIVSGVLLALPKLAISHVTSRIDDHIRRTTSLGSFSSSTDNLVQRIASSLVKVDFHFGIVYILLGLIMLTAVLAVRRWRNRPKPSKALEQDKDDLNDDGRPNIRVSRNRPNVSSMDVIGPQSNTDNKIEVKTAPTIQGHKPGSAIHHNKKRLIQ